MTTTKHTGGEWQSQQAPTSSHAIRLIVAVPADGPSVTVAEVRPNSGRNGIAHEEALANAALLAAAPALLEALVLLDWLLADAAIPPAVAGLIRLIIKAPLAKARGEG